jgi:hypothetical protein
MQTDKIDLVLKTLEQRFTENRAAAVERLQRFAAYRGLDVGGAVILLYRCFELQRKLPQLSAPNFAKRTLDELFKELK